VRRFSLKDYVAARGQIGTTSGILTGNGLAVRIDRPVVVGLGRDGSRGRTVRVDRPPILLVRNLAEEPQE
jgi:hypothetical protein